MIPYIVGFIAFLLFFSNPIVEYFSPAPARLGRTPRPAINESLLAFDAPNDTTPLCGPDAYVAHIFSKAPLVVYLEHFLTKDERDELISLSDPLFEPSTVTHDGDKVQQDKSIRDSAVALLPRADTVRCVERRALAFQGWREDLWIERLRTQKYGEGGHYAHHFDWGSGARGWGRTSSMMVWVAGTASVDVEGGGTEFPFLRSGRTKEWRDQWCKFVECSRSDTVVQDRDHDEEQGEEDLGVIFKPMAGNAVFWENFRPDGSGKGWEETWHAGLPVRDGSKIGLNIWSWGRLD